jgi:predicted ATP-dependent endonuclease of OLD family
MSHIVNIKINNFRGVSSLDLPIDPSQGFSCLIGRGDSGKSSILEAISIALAPRWNISIDDTDHFLCDPTNEIEIQVSVIKFPQEFMHHDKFGLLINAYCMDSKELLSVENSGGRNCEAAITIRLKINSDNEPQWDVFNGVSEKNIGWKDRAKFGCYFISDYVDSHFTWNQGLPLLKAKNIHSGKESVDIGVIQESLREARKLLDERGFPELSEITERVSERSKLIGVNPGKLKTSLDLRDLSRRDDKLTLHGDSIPLRLKGKGSKRMLSIAIQSLLVEQGGILLIDEIEQGLEPDRTKFLASYLNNLNGGQVFITTHSRDAIQEVGAAPLLLITKNSDGCVITKDLPKDNESLLKLVRACPEAFYSRKILFCEGRTEMGICRLIDSKMNGFDKAPFSFHDCSIVEGEGGNQVERLDILKDLFNVCWFCDSDVAADNEAKAIYSDKMKIVDCEETYNLEQQVIKDLPWKALKEVLGYAKNRNKDKFDNIFGDLAQIDIENIQEDDERRAYIIESIKSNASKKSKKTENTKFDFFKDVYGGEVLGEVIFRYWGELAEESRLKENIKSIIEWVEN